MAGNIAPSLARECGFPRKWTSERSGRCRSSAAALRRGPRRNRPCHLLDSYTPLFVFHGSEVPYAEDAPPVPTTEQLLIAALLNLPLAPAEVLGTFAGVVRQHAQAILTTWEGAELVQALHPHCLGASRMQLYALTALGVRGLFFQLADQFTQATHWQLDPCGLVLYHVPHLLRRQTAYRVAARIYAQAQTDHPQARLSWRLFLDSRYHLTVDYDSPRRRGPTTRRITVPSDLALAVTVQNGEETTWEQAQVWLDDGLMLLPRLQARLQVLLDAARQAPQTTPRTFVIVRDLARLGLWQLALDAVVEGYKGTMRRHGCGTLGTNLMMWRPLCTTLRVRRVLCGRFILLGE